MPTGTEHTNNMSSNSTPEGTGFMSYVTNKFHYPRADPGKPDKYQRSNERYPEQGHSTQLYEEYYMRLYNIWLDGAKQAKEAVGMYAENLQGILGARNDQEMSQKIVNAGETLKGLVKGIIDTQHASAILYINAIPSDQRNAAIQYWSRFSSQLRDYSEASRDSCGKFIKDLVDLNVKLRQVNGQLGAEINRVYDRSVLNLK